MLATALPINVGDYAYAHDDGHGSCDDSVFCGGHVCDAIYDAYVLNSTCDSNDGDTLVHSNARYNQASDGHSRGDTLVQY